MKRITLWERSGYDNRPRWWNNFIDYANSEEIVTQWYDLNDVLKPFNAKFWFNHHAEDIDTPRYLDFETEGDYLLFVLRFS